MTDDQILLKLRRRFKKDEAVAMLSQRLKETESENTFLKSELARLKYESVGKNNTIKKQESLIKRLNVKLSQIHTNIHQSEVVNEIRQKLNKYKKERNIYFNKYLSEKLKNERKRNSNSSH